MVTTLAPAKINLLLQVHKQRDDGYHNLVTLYQLLSWGDVLQVGPAAAGSTTSFSFDGPYAAEVPQGEQLEENLLWRAWCLMVEEAGAAARELRIHLTKKIPTGSGFGGGSSDAAALLLVLRLLWLPQLPLSRLLELARQLGADVPVFVQGFSSWAAGVGDELGPDFAGVSVTAAGTGGVGAELGAVGANTGEAALSGRNLVDDLGPDFDSIDSEAAPAVGAGTNTGVGGANADGAAAGAGAELGVGGANAGGTALSGRNLVDDLRPDFGSIAGEAIGTGGVNSWYTGSADYYLLFAPVQRSATAKLFQLLGRDKDDTPAEISAANSGEKVASSAELAALRQTSAQPGFWQRLNATAANDFLQPCLSAQPALAHLRAELNSNTPRKQGGEIFLSGSGSGMFARYSSCQAAHQDRKEVLAALTRQGLADELAEVVLAAGVFSSCESAPDFSKYLRPS